MRTHLLWACGHGLSVAGGSVLVPRASVHTLGGTRRILTILSSGSSTGPCPGGPSARPGARAGEPRGIGSRGPPPRTDPGRPRPRSRSPVNPSRAPCGAGRRRLWTTRAATPPPGRSTAAYPPVYLAVLRPGHAGHPTDPRTRVLVPPLTRRRAPAAAVAPARRTEATPRVRTPRGPPSGSPPPRPAAPDPGACPAGTGPRG